MTFLPESSAWIWYNKIGFCSRISGLTGLLNLLLQGQPVAEKEEAKAAFWAVHVDPASKAQNNGGAHFAFLADLVEKY